MKNLNPAQKTLLYCGITLLLIYWLLPGLIVFALWVVGLGATACIFALIFNSEFRKKFLTKSSELADKIKKGIEKLDDKSQ